MTDPPAPGAGEGQMTEAVPVLTETYGGWTTEWYCEPPPKGTAFTCVRDEWAMVPVTQAEGGVLRRVYEIRLAEPQ